MKITELIAKAAEAFKYATDKYPHDSDMVQHARYTLGKLESMRDVAGDVDVPESVIKSFDSMCAAIYERKS